MFVYQSVSMAKLNTFMCTACERQSRVCLTHKNRNLRKSAVPPQTHSLTSDAHFGFSCDIQCYHTDQILSRLHLMIQTQIILCGFCLFDSFLSRLCSYPQAADLQHLRRHALFVFITSVFSGPPPPTNYIRGTRLISCWPIWLCKRPVTILT